MAKAREILRGAAFPDAVRARLGDRAFKTQAFFDNIYYPDVASVTIDRHIITAAGFEDEWVGAAMWCYKLLAGAIQDLADDMGLKPHQAQAIIWITYKRVVGVDDQRVSGGLPF